MATSKKSSGAQAKRAATKSNQYQTRDRVPQTVESDGEVGGGGARALGDAVQYRSGDQTYSAVVVGVHPAVAADEALGNRGTPPMLDLKVNTGNPDTGGTELIYGVVVGDVPDPIERDEDDEDEDEPTPEEQLADAVREVTQ